MRKTTRIALVLGSGIALGAYLGFPTRVGLTKSQARVSMPGDLLLPTAGAQADRAATLDASPQRAWPLTADVKDLYEDIFDVPLELVYEDAPNLVVWKTSAPIREGEREVVQATVALTMNALGDETRVHVRERYEVVAGAKGKLASGVLSLTSGVLLPAFMRKNNRFLTAVPSSAVDSKENRK